MTVKPKDTIDEIPPDQACPADKPGCEATTAGSLLDGRIRYRQFRQGYRTGLEPVLMAAHVPARPGDRVLEGGCGAGAGLMCLAHRVAEVTGVGLEHDLPTAGLAQANFADNGFDRLHVARTTLPALPTTLSTLAMFPPEGGWFDHAFANPPWHRHDATASPDARRDLARRLASAETIAAWVGSLGRQVRRRGTLTLALPAALHDVAVASMREHGIGAISIFPFWPKAGRAARIVLVQGRIGSKGDAAILPGLVLHEEDGRFTPRATSVLRDGSALA
ncbi:methyltransferase [Gluconacetobacter johannae DSM 13595]|nr:methyltransferase [Gluconacetobacter johannae DSM 13595]